MFNLGWGEIVVIGIVALIAIGPKELPTVLRTVGLWMGKVRRMANEFQGQFQEALREAELSDLKKHADDLSNSVSDLANIDPLADTQKEMEKAFEVQDPTMDAGVPVSAPTDAEAAAPSSEPAPALPDGATLPPGVLPTIDVSLPELPAPVTEKDFAIAEPAPSSPASDPVPHPTPKQAGGGA
jgi:sec-independent protein translocase protein TatB